MPDVPPGYAQLTYVFRMAGDNEDMLTTLGVKITGSVSVVAVGVFKAAFANAFATQLSTALKLNKVVATIGQDGDPIVIESNTGPASFTGGDSLPVNCAFLVRKVTGLGGRRNRGRMYLPGCNDNLVDTLGTLTSGGVTSLQAACDAFRTALLATAEIDDLVVLHTATIPAVTPTVITSLAIDPRIATQRRRLRP